MQHNTYRRALDLDAPRRAPPVGRKGGPKKPTKKSTSSPCRQLLLAVRAARPADVIAAVKGGCDVDAILDPATRSTALLLAVRRGADGVVQALFDCGADVTACDAQERTVVHAAVRAGRPATLRLLLRLLMDVAGLKEHRPLIAQMDRRGRTPLDYAVTQGSTALVTLLLGAAPTYAIELGTGSMLEQGVYTAWQAWMSAEGPASTRASPDPLAPAAAADAPRGSGAKRRKAGKAGPRKGSGRRGKKKGDTSPADTHAVLLMLMDEVVARRRLHVLCDVVENMHDTNARGWQKSLLGHVPTSAFVQEVVELLQTAEMVDGAVHLLIAEVGERFEHAAVPVGLSPVDIEGLLATVLGDGRWDVVTDILGWLEAVIAPVAWSADDYRTHLAATHARMRKADHNGDDLSVAFSGSGWSASPRRALASTDHADVLAAAAGVAADGDAGAPASARAAPQPKRRPTTRRAGHSNTTTPRGPSTLPPLRAAGERSPRPPRKAAATPRATDAAVVHAPGTDDAAHAPPTEAHVLQLWRDVHAGYTRYAAMAEALGHAGPLAAGEFAELDERYQGLCGRLEGWAVAGTRGYLARHPEVRAACEAGARGKDAKPRRQKPAASPRDAKAAPGKAQAQARAKQRAGTLPELPAAAGSRLRTGSAPTSLAAAAAVYKAPAVPRAGFPPLVADARPPRAKRSPGGPRATVSPKASSTASTGSRAPRPESPLPASAGSGGGAQGVLLRQLTGDLRAVRATVRDCLAAYTAAEYAACGSAASRDAVLAALDAPAADGAAPQPQIARDYLADIAKTFIDTVHVDATAVVYRLQSLTASHLPHASSLHPDSDRHDHAWRLRALTPITLLLLARLGVDTVRGSPALQAAMRALDEVWEALRAALRLMPAMRLGTVMHTMFCWGQASAVFRVPAGGSEREVLPPAGGGAGVLSQPLHEMYDVDALVRAGTDLDVVAAAGESGAGLALHGVPGRRPGAADADGDGVAGSALLRAGLCAADTVAFLWGWNSVLGRHNAVGYGGRNTAIWQRRYGVRPPAGSSVRAPQGEGDTQPLPPTALVGSRSIAVIPSAALQWTAEGVHQLLMAMPVQRDFLALCSAAHRWLNAAILNGVEDVALQDQPAAFDVYLKHPQLLPLVVPSVRRAWLKMQIARTARVQMVHLRETAKAAEQAEKAGEKAPPLRVRGTSSPFALLLWQRRGQGDSEGRVAAEDLVQVGAPLPRYEAFDVQYVQDHAAYALGYPPLEEDVSEGALSVSSDDEYSSSGEGSSYDSESDLSFSFNGVGAHDPNAPRPAGSNTSLGAAEAAETPRPCTPPLSRQPSAPSMRGMVFASMGLSRGPPDTSTSPEEKLEGAVYPSRPACTAPERLFLTTAEVHALSGDSSQAKGCSAHYPYEMFVGVESGDTVREASTGHVYPRFDAVTRKAVLRAVADSVDEKDAVLVPRFRTEAEALGPAAERVYFTRLGHPVSYADNVRDMGAFRSRLAQFYGDNARLYLRTVAADGTEDFRPISAAQRDLPPSSFARPLTVVTDEDFDDAASAFRRALTRAHGAGALGSHTRPPQRAFGGSALRCMFYGTKVSDGTADPHPAKISYPPFDVQERGNARAEVFWVRSASLAGFNSPNDANPAVGVPPRHRCEWIVGESHVDARGAPWVEETSTGLWYHGEPLAVGRVGTVEEVHTRGCRVAGSDITFGDAPPGDAVVYYVREDAPAGGEMVSYVAGARDWNELRAHVRGAYGFEGPVERVHLALRSNAATTWRVSPPRVARRGGGAAAGPESPAGRREDVDAALGNAAWPPQTSVDCPVYVRFAGDDGEALLGGGGQGGSAAASPEEGGGEGNGSPKAAGWQHGWSSDDDDDSDIGRAGLLVDRQNFLGSIVHDVLARPPGEEIEVEFAKEPGSGDGPNKEFFSLLAQEVFTARGAAPLFDHALQGNNRRALLLSPVTAPDTPRLMRYAAAGRLLGMALSTGFEIGGAELASGYYKLLLSHPLTLADALSVDVDVHRSLEWVLRHATDADLDAADLMFTHTAPTWDPPAAGTEGEDAGSAGVAEPHDDSGPLLPHATSSGSSVAARMPATGTREYSLVPGGDCRRVTRANAEEFVRLKLVALYVGGVEPCFQAFASGFWLEAPLVVCRHIFTAADLQTAFAGSWEIDADDWQRHTNYETAHAAASDVVQWFWRYVRELSQEGRRQLLVFATGSSTLPAGGFAGLAYAALGDHGGDNFEANWRTFTLEVLQPWQGPHGEPTPREELKRLLPSAQTCFNTMVLPPYDSYEMLKDRLDVAIRMGSKGYYEA